MAFVTNLQTNESHLNPKSSVLVRAVRVPALAQLKHVPSPQNVCIRVLLFTPDGLRLVLHSNVRRVRQFMAIEILSAK